MKPRLCILCGMPVPEVKRPWHWRFWHVEGLPKHDPNGPDASRCYLEFQRRIGIANPMTLEERSDVAKET